MSKYDIVKAGCDGPLDAASGNDSQQCGYCPSYYCDINLNQTKVLQTKCANECAQKDADLVNMCVAAKHVCSSKRRHNQVQFSSLQQYEEL